MYKIEKNVPLPIGIYIGRSKYPFKDMKVGDSFAAPIKNTCEKRLKYNAITNAKIKFCQKNNNKPKFAIKALDSEVRIWRIK